MKKPWNWLTFLRGAIKKEPSGKSRLWAERKAESWPTCACGTFCRTLPRFSDGQPRDYDLTWLGYAFYEHVIEGRWSSALRTFLLIERRATLLLRQQKRGGK